MVGYGSVQYTLTIARTAGGTVTTPGVVVSTYAPSTVVNLVATPATDYSFVNWTGDVSTIANITAANTSITMSGNYSITANFAILIRDWYQLNAIRNNLSGNYLLMNNLDSTTAGYDALAINTANQGKGWEPIRNFTGAFDGQGYEIKDLFIDRPDEDNVGLFGYVQRGPIIWVPFGCVPSVSGFITDTGVVNATVTGYRNVGSLVGLHDGITVSNSNSTGNVTGNYTVGGLVGLNYGTVSNSYSTGSVTGNYTIGGLVGLNDGGTVSDSYATGSVTGNYEVGGLVGDNYGIVSGSFWDTQTSGQATSDGGTGKTTAKMKNIVTFSSTGWDIIAVANLGTRNLSYIWNIVDKQTYPFLSWQPV